MPKKEAQRSGWKSVQKYHKIKKKTKLALIVLGLLLTLLIFSQLINFVKLISNPLRSEISKNYTWNGDFNLNIVFRTSPILVASYNPQEGKVAIIQIPDETYIDVPGGYGRWQAHTIYSLGGDNLLKQSLSSFLGIPVDAIASHDLVTEFRRNFLGGFELLPSLQTDLTPIELVRLKIGLMQVRFDKITDVNLLDLGILDRENLADGTKVYIADPINLDSALLDFQEPKIRSENLSIAVFNATQTPQLAQKAKRLIQNLGGNVIYAQNAPKNVAKSYVDGQKSKTLERLTQIFGLDCSNNPNCDRIVKEDLGPIAARSRIIVILGHNL